jgi:hypothetical protein
VSAEKKREMIEVVRRGPPPKRATNQAAATLHSGSLEPETKDGNETQTVAWTGGQAGLTASDDEHWRRWLPMEVNQFQSGFLGVRRNPCVLPFRVPDPTICPKILIAVAELSTQPELPRIRRFRSCIPES